MKIYEISNDPTFKNKAAWLKAVKAAGATVQDDNEGAIASFGPEFKICGEWNDTPGMRGGVIYLQNVEAFKKAKNKS